MKACRTCGEEKPLEDFGASSSHRNGIDTQCRECRRIANRERMRKWRAADPERARQTSTEGSRRLRTRRPDYYRKRYHRLIEEQREYSRRYMRQWRKAHPEAARAAIKRYRAANLDSVRQRERENTHRRRALKGKHSPELAALMERLLQEPCTYCGATENITIDHVVPLSRGGKHEATNLAPACYSCNASKCNRLLSEWTGRVS